MLYHLYELNQAALSPARAAADAYRLLFRNKRAFRFIARCNADMKYVMLIFCREV